MTGEMRINGYLGYTLGFGDAFPDNDFMSVGPTFNIGGQFFYGWKENMMIGGELYLQNYTAKIKANSGLGIPSSSNGDMKFNILANLLYGMSQNEESAFYFIAGAGFYDYGGTSLGINGGILYEKAFGESMTFFAMPRLHIVFEDNTPMMLQLSSGATFPIGGGY